MAKQNTDALDMVDQLLSNEKAGVSPRKKSGGGVKEPYNEKWKKKSYKKSAPTKPMTEADMILCGWNIKYDENYVEPHKVGDIIDGIVVHAVGSYTKMARVYSPEFWIYGWGVNVDDAISECKKNIRAWQKKNPGKQPLKRRKKDKDKSVADILGEENL